MWRDELGVVFDARWNWAGAGTMWQNFAALLLDLGVRMTGRA